MLESLLSCGAAVDPVSALRDTLGGEDPNCHAYFEETGLLTSVPKDLGQMKLPVDIHSVAGSRGVQFQAQGIQRHEHS